MGNGLWNPTILNLAGIDTVVLPTGLVSEFLDKLIDAEKGDLKFVWQDADGGEVLV